MSDIVERMRRWEDRLGHPTCGEMLDEAAAEIERMRLAIRRLAEQDATLSVCDGAVTVQVDATLTDAEREAIERAMHEAFLEYKRLARVCGVTDGIDLPAVAMAFKHGVAHGQKQSALTDADREAIAWFAEVGKPLARLTKIHNTEQYRATLRGLLVRTAPVREETPPEPPEVE